MNKKKSIQKYLGKKFLLFTVLSFMLVTFFTGCGSGNITDGGSLSDTSQDSPSITQPSVPYYQALSEYEVSKSVIMNDDYVPDPIIVTTYSQMKPTETSTQTPVILYVVNHGYERIGTESDADILMDFLSEYIVVVVDYQQSDYAVSPYVEQSVMDIKNRIINKSNYLLGYSFGSGLVYTVPSGCRILRNVVYFDLAESGAKGSLDYIVDVWNSSQVKKAVGSKWQKATTVSDIQMKTGEALDCLDDNGDRKYLTYRMDIVYPSQPIKEAPVMLLGASSRYRNNSTGYTDHPERIQYIGFQLRGYAVACYDHEYIPFMQGTKGWGHINPDYSMCFLNGTKTHTAAVRCMRYYADKLGYSKTLYGVYGHSKSAWCSVLSAKDPESVPEDTTYKDYVQGDNYGEQPYLYYDDGTRISSTVSAVYHSMGFGSERYKTILQYATVPTFISCGQNDGYDNWSYWTAECEAYDNSGIEYIAVSMPAVTVVNPVPSSQKWHTIAPYVKDTTYDYYYYDSFKYFFDYHLLGDGPRYLYTSCSAEGNLSLNDQLFIQFSAPVINRSVEQFIVVKDSKGNNVVGVWTMHGAGNRWVFETDCFEIGESYTLTIGSEVKDSANKTIGETKTVKFTIS